jgi:hypothetical protein
MYGEYNVSVAFIFGVAVKLRYFPSGFHFSFLLIEPRGHGVIVVLQ